MKIQYLNIKTRLRNNLIMGIGLICWGIILIFLPESNRIIVLGYLLIALAYLSLYLYQRKRPYLTIENGLIYKDYIFSKKLALADIKTVDKVEGKYIIKTDKAQISINPNLIDFESLTELKSILKITE